MNLSINLLSVDALKLFLRCSQEEAKWTMKVFHWIKTFIFIFFSSWDDIYKKELENFAENEDDEGENW